MLILLLKAEQLGLFDKVVPVAGSVSATGVVRAPHFALRHVRPAETSKPKPTHHAESGDLFAHVPAAKTEAPKPTDPDRAERRLVALRQRRDPDGRGDPAMDAVDARVDALVSKPDTSAEPVKETPKIEHVVVPSTATVDYSKPFDPAGVPEFGANAGMSKDQRRAINADGASMVSGDLLGRKAPDVTVLRQYSGNGGCGDSLNEFYTDPKVAAGMWFALRGLGVVDPGATVLEPSCATGVFMATAPAGVKVTGVELDGVSARIGTVLHPGHEVQNASLESFATQDVRQFDAVIGNAPFGLRGGLIKDDKPDLKTAEAYFMDTALDKTRPGGVVAMIVPTGLMDSKRDRKIRARLLCKGEFLGALRMPNTAFEHSHTGVTSDVVFFRKRAQDVAGALSAVDSKTLRNLGVWDDEYLSGSYFEERGAANVLGTMTDGWRAKAGMGQDITVEGSMVGVPAAIAAFKPETSDAEPLSVEAILAAIPDEETKERVRTAAARQPYDNAKRGDVRVIDGIQYILEGNPLRWHRVDEFMADEAVRDAEGLAAAIDAQMSGDVQDDLAERVKAYVAKHGIPAKNANLMLAASQNKQLYRLIGAVKPDGSLSDVVTGRHAAPVESSFDAAAQSLALEAGWFKPEQVAARWHGGDTETVTDHLYASPDYAIDPVSGLWTSSDQYLSGELWPKFDEAKAALAGEMLKPEDRAKFERQLKAIEETIDPKSLEDVEVMLNSAFLPLKVVEGFFNRDASQFEGQHAPSLARVTFDSGVYAVKGGPWGTQLLEKYLNRTGVKKDDELPVIAQWNIEFKEWLCGSQYRDEVEELYNRSFRGFRQREYSTAPFEIPGLNTDGLKPHIYSGLRRALADGKGIVADDVGLGKTVQGLILARLAKASGRAKRPLIVVPKSVLAKWAAEAEKWFPGCSVLTIGETYSRDKAGNLKGKEDTAAERNRKYHDLTQNDYDFVLISQPAWNDLDLDPVTKGEYVESDFWVQRGDALGNAGDKRTNKIRESYNQAMASREFQTRTDAIYFNELGVDMLIGDEMHAYKNLYAAKNRFGQQPKFLGGSGLSNRALDMALKTRWLREQNGGLGVYGLTATPTKNSPLEIYSMLTHIAPEAFERIGIRNSEEFLDRFCEFKNENILNTRGDIEEALVTVGFKNLDELREIMRRFINRRTAEDVGLKLPARDDRQHLVDMTAEQNEVYAHLREQAELSKSKDGPHIFSVMDQMSKAAMDLELYNPELYAGAHSPKYAEAAKTIAEGAKEGGQVVFAEALQVHDKMVDALVAAGVPRDQIAVFNAQVASSAAKRQNIADAFNAGKFKVAIGNATMSEGVDLQIGTTDIHHMDLPWEPSTLQQRNGRGLRQGNTSEAVRIHTYIAKGSFDGYRYQTIAAKKDWQDLLWNGGDRVENLAREGALSRDDLMIMLAADPEEARKQLETNKEAAKSRFEAQKYGEAAGTFERFREMRQSHAKLKNKATPGAERLRVRFERMKIGLEADPFFKAKHALETDKPVVIHPETGESFEPGRAFEVPAEDGALKGGGKFVVTGVSRHPALGNLIQARRYGGTSGATMAFELKDLGRGVQHFEYDAKAEEAEIAKTFASAANDKIKNLKSYADLAGLPSSVVQANYAAIQTIAKAGAKDYSFNTGHGDIGMVKPDGTLTAAASYTARAMLDHNDLLLPTDEHRKLAIAAYVADERAKRFVREAVAGRRGGYTGESRLVVRWPNEYGMGGAANRWRSIGDSVFGKGFEHEARAEYEKAALEAGRRAPSFRESLDVLAPTATAQYGAVGAWPKRALAILWAKAKRDGKLDADLAPEMGSLPKELFTQSGGGNHFSPRTIREALNGVAQHRNMHDLASAFAVDAAPSPEHAAKELLKLRPDAAAAGLRHIVAKHPEIADRKAGEFARIEPARLAWDVRGSGATPAHPLHARFGDAAHNMSLAELADRLTAGDEGDDRRAA